MPPSPTSKALLSVCLLSLLPGLGHASEVDNFVEWRSRHKLKDSRPVIDTESARAWDEALRDVALEGCDERKLYKSLMKQFGNHVKTTMGKWLYATDQLDGHKIERKDSIYNNLRINESIVLNGSFSSFLDKLNVDIGLGKLVRYGDHYIGIDKFEHFWSTGASYFKEKNFKKRGSLEDALAYGEKMENGILGARTTGVYSYGDLSANFNGMRFWNHVLQKEDDVLGRNFNIGPYIACKNNKWETVKRPQWGNYIDASWSEANNCSKFRSQSMLDKVQAALASKNHTRGATPLICPTEARAMKALVKKYSPKNRPWLQRRLLNTRLGVVGN